MGIVMFGWGSGECHVWVGQWGLSCLNLANVVSWDFVVLILINTVAIFVYLLFSIVKYLNYRKCDGTARYLYSTYK